MTKKKNRIQRDNPPIYTVGFRLGITSDEICTIDFLDSPNEENIQKVTCSIALTKTQAKNIVKGLTQFVDEDIKK